MADSSSKIPASPVPPYKIKRTRRKTLAIFVLPGPRVEVRVPQRMPLSEKKIRRFIEENAEWIAKKSREMEMPPPCAFSLQEGDTLCYLGKEYPVKRTEALLDSCQFTGGAFLFPAQPPDHSPNAAPNRNQALAEQCYRELAWTYLPERTRFFSNKMGLFPQSVKISGAATRWGSCSSKKRINFSWRLMLAPPDTVDYVIVHELCHLRHLGHGADFWAAVEKEIPGWKRHRASLRQVQERLRRQGMEK